MRFVSEKRGEGTTKRTLRMTQFKIVILNDPIYPANLGTTTSTDNAHHLERGHNCNSTDKLWHFMCCTRGLQNNLDYLGIFNLC